MKPRHRRIALIVAGVAGHIESQALDSTLGTARQSALATK